MGIPFVAGILHENGMSYPIAVALATKTISEVPSELIREKTYERVAAVMKSCGQVIYCLKDFGTVNERNRKLAELSRDKPEPCGFSRNRLRISSTDVMIRRYNDKVGTDVKLEKLAKKHLKIWYDSTRACLETAFTLGGGNESSDTLHKKQNIKAGQVELERLHQRKSQRRRVSI